MIDRLRRVLDAGNAARLLASFVLAFTLWAWVTVQSDPERTLTLTNVAVSVENLPTGLEIVGPLKSIDLTLKGPQSIIARTDASNTAAVVDLSDVTQPGRYQERVKVRRPAGLRRAEASPSTITVELDTVVSKTFQVEVLPPGGVPRNLSVTGTIVSPQTVTVTGVQQNVDRVARTVVSVDLGNREESFTTQVTPRAVDANYAVVANVQVDPASVNLSVSVEVRGKEIPVFVRFSDAAAEGYVVIGQPMATPSTVLVDGSPELLAKVQYIYTTPIDTSTLTAPTVLPNVPLDTSSLPAGVTVERPTVNVSIRVEQAVFPRTFENLPVQVFNAPGGTRVSVNPSRIAVTIEGSQGEINALTANDVTVLVDVGNLGTGEFTITPRVMLPPQLSYSALPQVVVSISPAAPPATETPIPAPPVAPSVAPTS